MMDRIKIVTLYGIRNCERNIYREIDYKKINNRSFDRSVNINYFPSFFILFSCAL